MTDRVKQSIPIQGINTAEPCHTITDGYTEDIHNLRFRNGAFENVYEPKITIPISNNNGYTILHKMDCLPTQSYIALKNNILHMVSIKEGVVESMCSIGSVMDTDLKLHHFGNTLYANYKEDGQLVERCWIYKDGVFMEFTTNNLPFIDIEITYERKTDISNAFESVFGNIIVVKQMRKNPSGLEEEVSNEWLYNIPINVLRNTDYIVGNFVLMAAYKLFDGTYIKIGKPFYVNSYLEYKKNEFRGEYIANVFGKSLIRKDNKSHTEGSEFEITYYDSIGGVKPTIKLLTEIPKNDVVKSIVLLSTKAENIYDYENIYIKYNTGGHEQEQEDHTLYFSHRNVIRDTSIDLFNVPMYEIVDFSEEDIDEITLTYNKHYKDIITNNIYKASFSYDNLISEAKYTYNDRLHMYNVQVDLFSGYDFSIPLDIDSVDIGIDGEYDAWEVAVWFDIHIDIDGSQKIITKKGITKLFIAVDGSHKLALYNHLSYPDARATKITINYEHDSVIYCKTLPLKKILSNNLAYCEIDHKLEINCVSSYAVLTNFNLYSTDYSILESIRISQTDKLYVSALNNPFFFTPANIYTIGSNGEAINSIETSMEQITETKFGLYPLNVFTNRAIYAMEVGNGDITYQRVIGLSNESKLPGTTTVGAGNIVFFIGEQGVMAIQGRNIYCISNQMERYPALKIDLCCFDDYISHANLSYNPVLSELVVFNPEYDYAYVYSLTGKFWSRRDWDYKNISGSLYEIIIADKGIASAWKEDKTSPLRICTLETRAIKFGSMEYKRIETLIARLSVGSTSYYEILLYGSNDLLKWTTIGKTEKTPMIRRTGASFKYFKVKIYCTVFDYFTITNFDTEFYHRFVHKLR